MKMCCMCLKIASYIWEKPEAITSTKMAKKKSNKMREICAPNMDALDEVLWSFHSMFDKILNVSTRTKFCLMDQENKGTQRQER